MLYTWADLDNANRNHYRNSKPGYLVRARIKRDELQQRELEIIDAYEDGIAGWNEVKTIQRQVMHAEREYGRLYEKWNSEGIHVHNVAHSPAEVVNG